MKKLNLAVSSMLIFWTAVQPAWAEDTGTGMTSAPIEEIAEPRLSDLGIHINPQIGLSNFDYSKGDTKAKNDISGGATVEFGAESRRLETGLLLLRLKNEALSSSYLTIPMAAKLRLYSLESQTWYGKFGFLTAFETSSTRNSETNNLDVLGSLGIGGRFQFIRAADFTVEATYNRGLIDALRSAGQTYNQGFLVMAGMSFKI